MKNFPNDYTNEIRESIQTRRTCFVSVVARSNVHGEVVQCGLENLVNIRETFLKSDGYSVC